MIFLARSLADTQRLAAALARVLPPGSLVGLTGDLGAGKTALVRAFVAARSGDPEAVVTSPTFTLLNRYPAGGVTVNHFDVYRLASFEELEGAGARDLVFDPRAITFMEWVERVQAELGGELLLIGITLEGEVRRFTLSARGGRAQAALAELELALSNP
jgi:tRNA threonylcarbamoyladenosine biosynthesis protein TsaE